MDCHNTEFLPNRASTGVSLVIPIRKSTLYQGGLFVWAGLSAAAVILVYTGNAKPVVAPSQIPGDPWYAFVVVAALWLVGGVVVGHLRRRAWKRMGKETGLTPESGGLFAAPDLTGTVRGRPVRAHTVTRKRSGGESGSTSVTFTVVEAELAGPVEDGVLLGRREDGGAAGTVDLGDTSLAFESLDERFVAIGDGGGLAGAALSTRARNALLDLDEVDHLSVGDPTGAMASAVPDMSGSLVGDAIQSRIESRIADELVGGASTVTHRTKGTLLDGASLERQVTAVVAVADAVDGNAERTE